MSATVPTGLDLETPDVLGDDAVLCLATNHSEPADVAPIRTAMGS